MAFASTVVSWARGHLQARLRAVKRPRVLIGGLYTACSNVQRISVAMRTPRTIPTAATGPAPIPTPIPRCGPLEAISGASPDELFETYLNSILAQIHEQTPKGTAPRRKPTKTSRKRRTPVEFADRDTTLSHCSVHGALNRTAIALAKDPNRSFRTCGEFASARDYLNFWSTVWAVSVVSVTPRDATSVVARLQYVDLNGQSHTEDRRLAHSLGQRDDAACRLATNRIRVALFLMR